MDTAESTTPQRVTRHCPRCGEDILEVASACRFCGADFRPWMKRGRTWAGAVAAAVLLAGGWFAVDALRAPTEVDVVSQALECPSALANAKDSDLNDIAQCTAIRAGEDVFLGMNGKPARWFHGDASSLASAAMDCGTKGTEEQTAKCLLDKGLVSR